ncbi:MAG: NAD(P)H-dependent oxidoreductase subunit E [Bacteroidota bacterium]
MSENGVDKQEFTFTDAELAEVNRHLAKYPDPKSAVMPTLWIAQNKWGWLSQGAMELVAETLNLAYAHVYGVATFYTQYYKKPVPKYVIDLCTCFACGELGGDECLEHGKAITEADDKGYSADGLFYWRHAECLGSCDTGPMCQVTNKHYVHNLNKEKIEQLVADLRAGDVPAFVSIPLSDQSNL